jgi:hypothetical protein
MTPIGWPHWVDRERVRGHASTGWHARGHAGLGRVGPTGRGWAEMIFPFSFEFLILFIFIFSMEFKSNQATILNSNISNMCINQKQILNSS